MQGERQSILFKRHRSHRPSQSEMDLGTHPPSLPPASDFGETSRFHLRRALTRPAGAARLSRLPFSASSRKSTLFVNFAPVADVMQIDPAKFYVKLVKHAVIANAEFEFRTALQPFVRKIFQSQYHFINPAPHSFADIGRQIFKGFGESVRPDLERGSHDYSGWRAV